jgi:hypothetical protein
MIDGMSRQAQLSQSGTICSMFVAHPFSLNLAALTPEAAGVRAISIKTTTIKG